MTYTKEEVMTALREVVAEKGSEYVYPERVCRYAKVTGEPSCIVGHVIHKLDPEAFNKIAIAEAEGSATVDELVALEWIPSDFWDSQAEDALCTAQLLQDMYRTWGEALASAEMTASA